MEGNGRSTQRRLRTAAPPRRERGGKHHYQLWVVLLFFPLLLGWCCLASSFFDVVLLSPLPCVPSFRLVLLFLRSFRWCCLPLLLLGWWYHSVRHHTTRHYATAQHTDTAPHHASYNDADNNNFSDLSQFTWIFVGEHFEHISN